VKIDRQQPLVNISINLPELSPDLSNPNRPYDFQLQEKKKEKGVVTALIALKNTNPLKTDQELSSPRNRDNPSDHEFTLKCPRCNQKFSSKLKSNTKRNLVTHARRKKHPLTEKEIENCMYNVNEPKKCTYLTAPCPYQNSCKHVSKVIRKSTLKTSLLRHINLRHFNNQEKTKILENLSKDFSKYFEEHGKTHFDPNPNFVPNPNKKRKLQHPNRHNSPKKR